MEGKFDSKAYLEKLQAEITARATQTKGKFYIKINGKLLKDDYASRKRHQDKPHVQMDDEE